jgi:hypothetical protein
MSKQYSSKYDGFTSNDFYYIKETDGACKFYSKLTGTQTALNKIPPEVVGKIKEKGDHVSVKELTNERKTLENKLSKITKRMKEIDDKLNHAKAKTQSQHSSVL